MQPLHPFKAEPWLADTQLSGEAQWRDGHLAVRFVLDAPDASLQQPTATGRAERHDGLWQGTCFEAFIAQPGQERYLEINLATNGHWNVYALSSYRQHLQALAAVTSLPYVLRDYTNRLQIEFKLNLNGLIPAPSPVELSLTAVLDHPRHGCSYWAWHHDGDQPDFHRRASFSTIQPTR